MWSALAKTKQLDLIMYGSGKRRRSPDEWRDTTRIDSPFHIRQAVQNSATCWIAAVAFIIYNSRILWDLMNESVKKYVMTYLDNSEKAIKSANYSLRSMKLQEECRQMPSDISHFYDTPFNRDSGGYAEKFLVACAQASGMNIEKRSYPTSTNERESSHSPRPTLILFRYVGCSGDSIYDDTFNIHVEFVIGEVYKKFAHIQLIGGLIRVSREIRGMAPQNHALAFVHVNNENVLCLNDLAEDNNNNNCFPLDGSAVHTDGNAENGTIVHIDFIFVRLEPNRE
jgi:hypothetical protein